MEDKDTEGTVLSKAPPMVTMLTDTLRRDFAPGYVFTTDEQLQHDVEEWLLALETHMPNDTDREYAKVVAHMVRKNKGWVIVLANRVKKALA